MCGGKIFYFSYFWAVLYDFNGKRKENSVRKGSFMEEFCLIHWFVTFRWREGTKFWIVRGSDFNWLSSWKARSEILFHKGSNTKFFCIFPGHLASHTWNDSSINLPSWKKTSNNQFNLNYNVTFSAQTIFHKHL